MKNKIKRNRILPLLIIGAATISLGTVAFSTWILSWDNSESTFNSLINVDGYKHTTIVCEGNYNVFKINFDGENGGSGITSSDSNGETIINPTLNTSVLLPSSYFETIETSGVTTEEQNNTKVGEIRLNLNATIDGLDKNLITNTSNFSRDPSIVYNYLSLSNSTQILTYGDFIDYASVAGYKIAEISIPLTIEYGTYFNNVSPDSFYKNIIENAKTEYINSGNRDTYLTTLKTITNELDLFRSTLNEKTLNIEIKAVINGINDN